MKKFILALSVCAFFAGCAGTSSNGPAPTVSETSTTSMGNRTYDSIQAGVNEQSNIQGKAVLSDACKSGNVSMCRSFAESMYKKGDFASAINAYNINCAAAQDIPSFVQMAYMFEKGEGVEKNINNAVDIFMRACYGGHAQSCKEMRRLGYKG